MSRHPAFIVLSPHVTYSSPSTAQSATSVGWGGVSIYIEKRVPKILSEQIYINDDTEKQNYPAGSSAKMVMGSGSFYI